MDKQTKQKWNPQLSKIHLFSEKYFKRATKVPHLNKHLRYESRMAMFKIKTVIDRRTKFKLQTLYKNLNLNPTWTKSIGTSNQ